MHVEVVEWDESNLVHATRHGVSVMEIEQAIGNLDRVVRNKKGRSGDYVLRGTTNGGRRVAVVIAHNPEQASVRPITAWENR